MFVILTSKPGEFRTEPVDGLQPLERYDYVFFGRKRAEFLIARLERDVKIRIVEESGPALVNLVPSKFLPKFTTVEKARAELEQLASQGGSNASLVRKELR